jgi:magnesium-transporting ATPase (P-type)
MYHDATLPEEEIVQHLDTSLTEGLSSPQAEERIATAGYNEITANPVPWWEIAIRQFRSAFVYLLLVAAAIVFVIGEYTDAGIIFLFVIINAALGFYQEYRSEQALRVLRQYITPRARVKRDSRWHTINSRNLVPGDIIRVETGDAVPADLRILSSHNLIVNETALTGESVPVRKSPETLAAEPENAEAHVGLGRIYLRSAFYTLAQQHFDQALARMPDNQEVQKGLWQAQSLTTPQLQALAGYFEDSEGFRRTFLYSSYRLYLHPRLRLYGGYGFLD